MDSVYFDWSQHRGICTLTNDDELELAAYYRTLDEMLESLDAPCLIVGEASFESFRVAKRQIFIDRCAALGHDLRTVPTRQTTRWRHAEGFGDKKSQSRKADAEDAACIRAMVKAGMHLKVPTPRPGPEFQAKRERIARNMVTWRNEFEMEIGPRGGIKNVKEKERIGALLRDELPDYGAQPTTRQLALGDGKSWNTTALVAVWATAREASNRREFERLAGLYAHGYGCQVRADLMYFCWTGGTHRKVDKATRKHVDGLTLSEFRREIRWLYQHLKNVKIETDGGTPPPVMGTPDPPSRAGVRAPYIPKRAHGIPAPAQQVWFRPPLFELDVA